MEENICNQCNEQEIHLQILQIGHPAQYQNTKQLNQNMGRRPKQKFLQRKHTNAQKAHKKMINITNY